MLLLRPFAFGILGYRADDLVVSGRSSCRRGGTVGCIVRIRVGAPAFAAGGTSDGWTAASFRM